MRTVPVELGDRGYDVIVGPGAGDRLAEVVAAAVPQAARAAVVTQAGIGFDVDPGLPTSVFEVPDGEPAKTLAVVERLCRDFVRAGLGRTDLVVAVGGGVVTDVAGFAAAAYHRGTPYVNVATTLLAQVDAAIGGKTGVNLEEGKNLVGAFWQPRAVVCDIRALDTLPAREWASGRGEMAKYALLASTVGGEVPSGSQFLELPLEEQVTVCAAIKATVVAVDEHEGGLRAVLNYGHTLAHALEASALADGRTDLRHGEAVAVGLVFAAGLARRLGRIDDERVALHRRVVGGFDLSPALPEDVDPARLLTFMARDKKARHDLTFVLDGADGVEPVHGVGPDDVLATLAAMERTADGTARTDRTGRIGVSARGLIVLLSGPNLDLLGEREPEIYGQDRLEDHVTVARKAAADLGYELEHTQTNHEGDLVEAVHRARGRAVALVVNAGALSHTSWSLHDALAAFDGVVVELHLSNPAAREPFRHTSVLAPVADGSIAGFGGVGYQLAVEAVDRVRRAHGDG